MLQLATRMFVIKKITVQKRQCSLVTEYMFLAAVSN